MLLLHIHNWQSTEALPVICGWLRLVTHKVTATINICQPVNGCTQFILHCPLNLGFYLFASRIISLHKAITCIYVLHYY